jgi:hypothetical protein
MCQIKLFAEIVPNLWLFRFFDFFSLSKLKKAAKKFYYISLM